MTWTGRRAVLLGAICLLACSVLGCALSKDLKPVAEPLPRDLRPTNIDYADSDAFDAVLEAALVNEDPAIIIHTDYQKPEWGARLNAWIAAWNRGGNGRKVRLQAPLVPQVVVDGKSIREFRLLIEGFMNRVEDRVQQGSTWWVEERLRNHRVELLKPYNLRFHLAEDNTIHIILFHGRYAASYHDFVRSLPEAESDGSEEWERTFQCSRCKRRPAGPDQAVQRTTPADDSLDP